MGLLMGSLMGSLMAHQLAWAIDRGVLTDASMLSDMLSDALLYAPLRSSIRLFDDIPGGPCGHQGEDISPPMVRSQVNSSFTLTRPKQTHTLSFRR